MTDIRILGLKTLRINFNIIAQQLKITKSLPKKQKTRNQECFWGNRWMFP